MTLEINALRVVAGFLACMAVGLSQGPLWLTVLTGTGLGVLTSWAAFQRVPIDGE